MTNFLYKCAHCIKQLTVFLFLKLSPLSLKLWIWLKSSFRKTVNSTERGFSHSGRVLLLPLPAEEGSGKQRFVKRVDDMFKMQTSSGKLLILLVKLSFEEMVSDLFSNFELALTLTNFSACAVPEGSSSEKRTSATNLRLKATSSRVSFEIDFAP